MWWRVRRARSPRQEAVGEGDDRGRDRPLRAASRTDPSVRDYRIGLCLGSLASKRAASRTRASPLGTPCPALRPGRVGSSVFPSASPLSSTTSAAGALFGGFAGTTGLSDFPWSCISGVRPRPSLSDPSGDRPDGWPWDLPVLAHGDSVHAQVLRPRGARPRLADNAVPGVALPAIPRTSAPRTHPFRGSIARPARTPVNASPTPLRTPTHDSGPPWVATPSV
jgi:hypothetical protein